jgi:uncharacterized protein YbaR (Trm112 family)
MVKRFWNLIFGWRKFRIRKDEFVLDVGSGDNPCFRADVICDRYPVDSSQRSGQMKIQIYPHQKLIIGDVQSLPFKDKSFDFVICRHLLEHLENPGRGMEELTRVGRRGYIETPSALMEMLYGWDFHKWLVGFRSGNMIFTKKDKSQIYGILPNKIKKDKSFEELVHKNPDIFLVRCQWDGEINYKIEFSEEASDKFSITNCDFLSQSEFASISMSRGWLKNFILQLARISWATHRIDLLDILACPVCKNKVEFHQESNRFVCSKCQRSYRIWNGIPILLSE